MSETVSFSITDNSKSILNELQRKKQNILDAWGLTAETYAKRDTPVNTGRLRNSITYATRTTQSEANTLSGEKADTVEFRKQSTPEKDTVYIGTNVIYAPAVELNDSTHKSGKAHFLRDSVSKHRKEYEEIAREGFKK